MVVLEAAAIGAASYGLYKGGEAGVKKGKECRTELIREKKRSGLRSGLHEKAKSRGSRIAEIVRMKKNVGTTTSDEGGTPGLSRFGVVSKPTSATRASFAERQIAEKEANSDIDDRHRTVMQKLRSSRTEERKKGSSKQKLLSFNNPFKKK